MIAIELSKTQRSRMSPFTKPIITRRFVDLRRRSFLKTGVAGSALLLAGRWLAPARAADSGAVAGAAFANINADDARVLERIVPVLLEGALPADPAQRKAAIGE